MECLSRLPHLRVIVFSKYLLLFRQFVGCVSLAIAYRDKKSFTISIRNGIFTRFQETNAEYVGIKVNVNSPRKFTKTLTYCILLYLTMWSFPSTSFNAIRVMPIIYATRAIYALRSTNTLWFSKHLKEHRQGLSNHLYKELPYEASLSPLFIRCDFVYQGDDTNLEHSNRIHSSKTFHSDNYSILLFSTFQCYVSHLFFFIYIIVLYFFRTEAKLV